MHEERIKLKDTSMDSIVKLSEGNPVALSVLAQLMKDSEKIDPIAFMGPMAHILSLDSFGIYGSRI